MTDPIARHGFPPVTIPRDMIEHSRPPVIDQVKAHMARAADRWLAMTPAEREAELDRREAALEARRDDWLRGWIADQRTIGLAAVDAQLDGLCRDLGLDPHDTWRRPRAHARAARLADMTASIRRDLVAAGHQPVTSALERGVGVRVALDPTMPDGVVVLADDDGRELARIEGVQ